MGVRRFLHGWRLGGDWPVVIGMMIGVGRVSCEVTVHGTTVVMAGVVRRIGVQMDERRRQRAQLQAETHEQHEAEALHVSRIVAHIDRVVKDAGFVRALQPGAVAGRARAVAVSRE